MEIGVIMAVGLLIAVLLLFFAGAFKKSSRLSREEERQNEGR